jgi:hypothetical protein
VLRNICDIVFAPVIDVKWLPVLDQYIHDHHRLFISLDANAFTPKMHFLCHYPRLIEVYGPLRQLWCMRFEAYHQYLKSIVHHTGNFINICKTLAERNQLKKCYEQLGENCLQSPADSEGFVAATLSQLAVPVQQCVSKFFSCSLHEVLMSAKSANLSCMKYSVDNFFWIDLTSDDVPVFIHIKHLLSLEGSWCLVGRLVTAESYLHHYHCYTVHDVQQWTALAPGSELDYHPLSSYVIDVNGDQISAVS